MATEELVEATNGAADDIKEATSDVQSDFAGVAEQETQESKKDSPAEKAAPTPTSAAKSTPAAKEDAAKDKKDEEVTEDTKEDALEEEQELKETSTAAAPESEEVNTYQMSGPRGRGRTYTDSEPVILGGASSNREEGA